MTTAGIEPPIPTEAIAELEQRLGKSLKGWDACPPRFSSPRPDVAGARFDVDEVERIVRRLRDLPHTKGRWAKSPFDPEPWQLVWLIAPVFGWKNADGFRICREVWFEVPRKNGKSSIASRFALILLGADNEPGAEVYAAATSEPQARQVFDEARTVISRSPRIKTRAEILTSVIRWKSNGGIFRVLSKTAEAAHGLNVSGAVVDEVHVHRKRDLIDAIETGTAARSQPLIVYITTAGNDDDTTIYAEKHEYAVKIANGDVTVPTQWVAIWAADPDADPFSEETWRQANPNFPESPSREYLEEKAQKAQETPTFLPVFKRLHLNIRATSATEAWGGADDWSKGIGLVPADKLDGRAVWLGIKTPRVDDLAAVAYVYRNPEGPGWWFRWRWYLPEASLESLNRRTGGHASTWVDEGRIALTEGDYIDSERITEDMAQDFERYDVREVMFDPNGATPIALPLAGRFGIEPVPIHATSPHSALVDWERLLRAGEVNHGGDPIAKWQVLHVRVKEAATGVVKIDHRASTDNVYGISAAEMALRRALVAEEPRESVYERRGLLTL